MKAFIIGLFLIFVGTIVTFAQQNVKYSLKQEKIINLSKQKWQWMATDRQSAQSRECDPPTNRQWLLRWWRAPARLAQRPHCPYAQASWRFARCRRRRGSWRGPDRSAACFAGRRR